MMFTVRFGVSVVLGTIFLPFATTFVAAAPATQPGLSIRGMDVNPMLPAVSIRAHAKTVSAMQFLPDNRRLLSVGEDDIARLWDAETGKMLREYSFAPAKVLFMAISHDGKRVAVGGKDKAVRVCDIETGDVIALLEPHSEGVTSLAFRDNGELVTGGKGGYFIWDVEKEQPVYRSDPGLDTFAFSASANGKVAAYLSRSMRGFRLSIVDLDKRQVVRETIALPNVPVSGKMGLSTDGRILLGYMYLNGAPLETAFGFDTKTATPIDLMPEAADAHSYSFTADGSRALIAQNTHDYFSTFQAHLIDTSSPDGIWRPLAKMDRMHCRALAISPDGKRAAVGSGTQTTGEDMPGNIHFYDLSAGLPKSPGVGTPVGSVSWDAIPITYQQLNGKALPLDRISRTGWRIQDSFHEPRVRKLAEKLDVAWWTDAIAIMRDPATMTEIARDRQESFSDVVCDGKHIFASSLSGKLHIFSLDGAAIKVDGATVAFDRAGGEILLYPLGPNRILAMGGDRPQSSTPRSAARAPHQQGWCRIVELVENGGSRRVEVQRILSEADLPANWPRQKVGDKVPMFYPQWIQGESAGGKLTAVWIGFNGKAGGGQLIRVDPEKLSWSARNLGTSLPITDPPVIRPKKWVAFINRNLSFVEPNASSPDEWSQDLSLKLRTGISAFMTLLDGGDDVYLAGQEWYRVNPATKAVTNLGPGLRIDGATAWDGIHYYVSAHAPLAGVSQKDGCFYRFSVDPSKAGGTRPATHVLVDVTAVKKIIHTGRETHFLAGGGTVSFFDTAPSGRWAYVLPHNPITQREMLATSVQDALALAMENMKELSADEKDRLKALPRFPRQAYMSPEETKPLREMFANYLKASPADQPKAAEPIFAAAELSAKKRDAVLSNYVKSARSALSPQNWKKLCEQTPGLYEEVETFFPR